MPTASAGDLCVISAPCEIRDRIELDSSHEPNWNEKGTFVNMPVALVRILSIAHRCGSRVSESLGKCSVKNEGKTSEPIGQQGR